MNTVCSYRMSKDISAFKYHPWFFPLGENFGGAAGINRIIFRLNTERFTDVTPIMELWLTGDPDLVRQRRIITTDISDKTDAAKASRVVGSIPTTTAVTAECSGLEKKQNLTETTE